MLRQRQRIIGRVGTMAMKRVRRLYAFTSFVALDTDVLRSIVNDLFEESAHHLSALLGAANNSHPLRAQS
jgi:hypothetical protein